MNRKSVILLVFALFLIVGGVSAYLMTSKNEEPETTQSTKRTISDDELGISFSLPNSYEQRSDTPPAAGQKGAKSSINFEQESPQGLLTFRYESGLALAANAARMPLIDYIQSNLQQFFPSRYKDYKPISLSKTEVAGNDAIDHTFSYSDQDGNKVISRLVVVPSGNDSAYYIILQASESNFESVKKDMDGIKSSFKVL